MTVFDTHISGVHLIDLELFADERGAFSEVLNVDRLKALTGEEFCVQQINVSISKKSVLRGMHFQTGEFAQAKLVRVIKGAIFDVCVDLRRSSETFGKWTGVELHQNNMNTFYVPRGLAHGFCVLTDETVVEYITDNRYSPDHERCLLWNDPDVNIEWPHGHSFCLSAKDQAGKNLKDCEIYD